MVAHFNDPKDAEAAETWKKKFRRVLLVHQSEVSEAFINIISEFANDVTSIDLDNYCAGDYLQLPADCMVVDGRAEDLTGIGYAVGTAQLRGLPSLVFCLRSSDPHDAMALAHPTTKLVAFSDSDYRQQLKTYLEETESFPYEIVARVSPWVMRPWTISAFEMVQALSGREQD